VRRVSGQPKRAIAWELQLIGWIPLPTFAAGAVVSFVIGVGLLLQHWAIGESTYAESGRATVDDLVVGLIVAALIGYTMAAGRYLQIAILGDVYEAAGLDRETVWQLDEITVFGTSISVLRRSRLAGTVGALVGLWMLHSVGTPIFGEGGQLGELESLAWLSLAPLLWFLLARAAFNTVLGSTERSVSQPHHPKPHPIDLLDLRSVYARGRTGLRLALVWIVGSTIASPLVFDPALTIPLLPFLLAGVGVAVAALLLPSRRLHRMIQDEKRRELDRLRAELHRVRDDMLAGRSNEDGRLADLLGYRTYIEQIRDWPFDNPTVLRFLLYLLIPIGSWLGGAVVERMVSNLLD